MTYRSFDTEFWKDPWIESLSLPARAVFIYLWTNEHCSKSGIYEITIRRAAFECGISEDELNTLFTELNERKVVINSATNTVWIKNFLHYQCRNKSFAEAALNHVASKYPQHLQGFIEINQVVFNQFKCDTTNIPLTPLKPHLDHTQTPHSGTTTLTSNSNSNSNSNRSAEAEKKHSRRKSKKSAAPLSENLDRPPGNNGQLEPYTKSLLGKLEAAYQIKLTKRPIGKNCKALSELHESHSPEEIWAGLERMQQDPWWHDKNPDFSNLLDKQQQFLGKANGKDAITPRSTDAPPRWHPKQFPLPDKAKYPRCYKEAAMGNLVGGSFGCEEEKFRHIEEDAARRDDMTTRGYNPNDEDDCAQYDQEIHPNDAELPF